MMLQQWKLLFWLQLHQNKENMTLHSIYMLSIYAFSCQNNILFQSILEHLVGYCIFGST